MKKLREFFLTTVDTTTRTDSISPPPLPFQGANILFIRELADQLKGTKVICLSLHPGVIASTGLGRNMSLGAWAMDLYGAITGDAKSIPQGAATTLTACLDPALAAHSGAYLVDCRIAESSPHCQDASGELRKALWRATASDISEALKIKR